jgi:hypothetical protein
VLYIISIVVVSGYFGKPCTTSKDKKKDCLVFDESKEKSQ